MKKINKRELWQLSEVEPENLMNLRLLVGPRSTEHDNIGFQIVGRLLSDGRYIKYSNRIVGWNDLFAQKRSNVWDYILQTEDEYTDSATIVSNNAVKCFMDETKAIAAYAVTEQEFNECVPVMKEGTYVFFVERKEKADFNKEKK